MKTIWIVDDDATLAESLQIFLQDRYSTHFFGSAAEALEAFDQNADDRPSIVVTDLKMPGLNGLELIRQLRAKGCSSLNILLSGVAGQSDLVHASQADFVGFLEKPCDPKALLEIIQQAERSDRAQAGDILIPTLLEQISCLDELMKRYTERLIAAENLIYHAGLLPPEDRSETGPFSENFKPETELERRLEEVQMKCLALLKKFQPH